MSASLGASSVGTVLAVCASPTHTLSKVQRESIVLVEGEGVHGDAHRGAQVKHRSRVRRDPTQPNLRQVHLIHAELHEELARRGMPVSAGTMGENVTTAGVDLLALPRGSELRLGPDAVIEITGLRNPCTQLDSIHDGLMAATLDRASDGSVVRRAGIMAVVLVGGVVRPGDPVHVSVPPPPHEPLDRV